MNDFTISNNIYVAERIRDKNGFKDSLHRSHANLMLWNLICRSLIEAHTNLTILASWFAALYHGLYDSNNPNNALVLSQLASTIQKIQPID